MNEQRMRKRRGMGSKRGGKKNAGVEYELVSDEVEGLKT